VVRGVAALIAPWRPAYFCRFRNSSIALRISQETERSSRTESFFSFSTCSGLSRMAVSFFVTVLHYTTMLYAMATEDADSMIRKLFRVTATLGVRRRGS
jgi:hypothetical protein